MKTEAIKDIPNRKRVSMRMSYQKMIAKPQRKRVTRGICLLSESELAFGVRKFLESRKLLLVVPAASARVRSDSHREHT